MITVHASVDIRALHVLALVLLAGDIGNAIFVHISVSSVGITTIASSSISTVNKSLDGGNGITLSTCTLQKRYSNKYLILHSIENHIYII